MTEFGWPCCVGSSAREVETSAEYVVDRVGCCVDPLLVPVVTPMRVELKIVCDPVVVDCSSDVGVAMA